MVTPSNKYSDIGDFEAGESGWWFGKPEAGHVGLRDKLAELGIDVIHRGTSAEISDHTPQSGTAFYAEDTEVLHLGDGTQWNAQATWGANPTFTAVESESISTHRVPPNAGATEIQAAIDAAAAETSEGNIAVIRGRADAVYDIDQTLILPSNCYLRDFHFRIADGANCTAIKTTNFDTLTGTNERWDGVPFNFGFENIRIDGNKTNNTSGSGIKVFANFYYADDILIRDCAEDGFYSERGSQGGIASWNDLPEACLGMIRCSYNGGRGFVWRGPNDAILDTLFSNGNGGTGFEIDGSGNYSGYAFHANYIHPYGNGAPMKVAGETFANQVNVDNEPGLDVTSNLTTYWLSLKSSHNGDSQVSVDGFATMSAEIVRVFDTANTTTTNDCITLNTSGNYIGQLNSDPWSHGDVVVVNDNNNIIKNISATNVSGYAVNLGGTQTVANCDIEVKSGNNCTGGVLLYNGVNGNNISLRSFISSGNVGIDTTNSVTPNQTDNWNVSLRGSGSGLGYHKREGTATFTGDGTTGPYSISFAGEGLAFAPNSITAQTASTGGPPVANTENWTKTGFDVVLQSTTSSSVDIAYRATITGAL